MTTRIDELLAQTVPERDLRNDGNYTIPRSFGVYQLAEGRSTGKLFRFGNHPVRRNELVREHGNARLVGLFLERSHAEELCRRLNRP